jgi:hypothetical protein
MPFLLSFDTRRSKAARFSVASVNIFPPVPALLVRLVFFVKAFFFGCRLFECRMYANNDVMVLDDPLSAVDAHVAEHIFSECLMVCTSLSSFQQQKMYLSVQALVSFACDVCRVWPRARRVCWSLISCTFYHAVTTFML